MLSRGARGASLLPRAGSRGISVRTTCHRDELEKQHMSEEETTSFEKVCDFNISPKDLQLCSFVGEYLDSSQCVVSVKSTAVPSTRVPDTAWQLPDGVWTTDSGSHQ